MGGEEAEVLRDASKKERDLHNLCFLKFKQSYFATSPPNRTAFAGRRRTATACFARACKVDSLNGPKTDSSATEHSSPCVWRRCVLKDFHFFPGLGNRAKEKKLPDDRVRLLLILMLVLLRGSVDHSAGGIAGDISFFLVRAALESSHPQSQLNS